LAKSVTALSSAFPTRPATDSGAIRPATDHQSIGPILTCPVESI
jgi:hypothetical protein